MLQMLNWAMCRSRCRFTTVIIKQVNFDIATQLKPLCTNACIFSRYGINSENRVRPSVVQHTFKQHLQLKQRRQSYLQSVISNMFKEDKNTLLYSKSVESNG